MWGDAARSVAAETFSRLRGLPLAALPRAGGSPVVTIEEAYQPLLTDWTDEDAAAKGLRRGVTQRPPPVHHTALERAAAEPVLLLTGEAGSGRTTFCRDLALHLAGEVLGERGYGLAQRRRAVPRGPDGTVREEAWTGPVPLPLLLEDGGTLDARLAVAGPQAEGLLRAARAGALPHPLLLILDAADRLGDDWAQSLLHLRAPGLRLLATADRDAVPGLPGFRRHAVLPLLRAQRAAFLEACAARLGPLPALGDPASLPGVLALQVAVGGDTAGDVAARFSAALEAATDFPDALRPATGRMMRPHLLARSLEGLAPALTVERAAGREGAAALRLLAEARPDQAAGIAEALLALSSDDAILLAADLLRLGPAPDASRARVAQGLVRIIGADGLTPARRALAGRHLAALGDPRDLEALVAIPAGPFTMGSASPPNSAPPHAVNLPAYRIGRYPVTNRLYARFADETGRPWPTANGRDPERANHPVTDVTWRDARACCDWLTPLRRLEERIGADEVVRLPTEAEWECAARGAAARYPAASVYGYEGPWQPHRANDEAAGLNEPVAVGLFPAGRSPEGCDDLCGNVWEWCSSLWGGEMAVPAFAYPYDAADGREDPDAAPAVRRILRGGCFSSATDKATATYRGALEPDGFWRGNGFRIVVAPA
ncbi:SUMF1/EgtB/PvdO family nonheme iron enzyme [Roseomonas sp. CCTCC AB2023176]|uniref:SUMF1/EgtB/PvdO family nonheme iron enzyme n=1 Tax=Roseomonas sp. CCTCC AB2023176 TaxID=3342640 RepID=UPI0035DA68A9